MRYRGSSMTGQGRLLKETEWALIPSLTASWYNMRARRYPGLAAYAALSACSFYPSSLTSLTWLITLRLRPRFELYATNLQFLAAARIKLPPSPISFSAPCFEIGASYVHFRKFTTHRIVGVDGLLWGCVFGWIGA